MELEEIFRNGEESKKAILFFYNNQLYITEENIAFYIKEKNNIPQGDIIQQIKIKQEGEK